MPNLGKRLMESRTTLMVAVMFFSVCSLFLPPMTWGAAVLIAMATLVLGPGEGLLVLSFAAMPIVGFVLANDYGNVLLYFLLNLSVVWSLATVLHITRSWNLVLSALVGVGVLMVVSVVHYLPEVFSMLGAAVDVFVKELEKTNDITVTDGMLTLLSQVSLGYYVFDFMLSALFAVLFARAWQAKLYNPGGLAKEFSVLLPDTVSLVLFSCVVVSLLLQVTIAVSLLPVVVFPLVFYGFSALQRKAGHSPNRKVLYAIYGLGCVFVLYMLLPAVFLSVSMA